MVWSGQVGVRELSLFSTIREIGYDGVEIPIFDPDALDPDAVRAALADNGLTCTASTALPPALSLIDTESRVESVRWLGQVVRTASAIGASILCGPLAAPVGALRGRGYTASEWESGVQALRQVGEIAADHGVRLAFEPLNRFETFFLNTVEDGVRLVEEVDNAAVGLLLDTFHMNIEEKSTAAAIRRAAGHLYHFHASEHDRGTVGSGQVLWPQVFDSLDAVAYKGWIVVESFNAVIPDLAGATCVWRPLAESPDALARGSFRALRSQCDSDKS